MAQALRANSRAKHKNHRAPRRPVVLTILQSFHTDLLIILHSIRIAIQAERVELALLRAKSIDSAGNGKAVKNGGTNDKLDDSRWALLVNLPK